MSPSVENSGADFGPLQAHPRTYRIDSIEVEAVQWDGTAEGAIPIINWVRATQDGTARYFDDPDMFDVPVIAVDAFEFNKIHVNGADWLIRMQSGRFLVCADSTFQEEYTLVPEKSEAALTALQALADELNAVGASRAQREGREFRTVALSEPHPPLMSKADASDHEKADDTFSFHPADTDAKRDAHENVRALLRATAHELIDGVPPSDARTLALQHLADAMHWANAAIARYGPVKS